MYKIALKYGLIGSVLSIIVFVGIHLIGLNPYDEAGFFDFLLLPIFIFFGLLEFKKLNRGNLEYAQGMTIGVITFFTIAIVSSIFLFLFHLAVGQEVLTDYINLSIESLNLNRDKMIEEIGAKAFDETLREVKETSVLSMVLDNFLKKSIVGMLLTIMISIILRKSLKK